MHSALQTLSQRYMSEFDFIRAVFVHATELAWVPLFYFVKTAVPLCKVNPRKTNARLQIAAMAY